MFSFKKIVFQMIKPFARLQILIEYCVHFCSLQNVFLIESVYPTEKWSGDIKQQTHNSMMP